MASFKSKGTFFKLYSWLPIIVLFFNSVIHPHFFYIKRPESKDSGLLITCFYKLTYSNALIPVTAIPVINKWISCVPS